MERTPIVQQLHDLTVNLHDSRATVTPGGTIVYTVEYANAGVAPASGAAVTIDLPDKTVFNPDASTSGWGCEAGKCSLAIGDVQPGEEGTATFAVDVSNELSTTVRAIRATASIADDGEGASDAHRRNNVDGASTPVVHALPDLVLRMDDGDQGVSADGTIVYALEYSNEGSVEATGAVISIPIPHHTSFDAAGSSAGWECNDGVCTLQVGTVAPASSGTASFAVVLDTELSASVRRISARAHISDDGANGEDAKRRNNLAHERTSVLHALPDVTLELDDGDQDISPGGTIVYSLGYSNKGPVNATGVVLTLRVPRNSVFNESESTDGWNCEGRSCTFDLGDLAAGSSGSVTLAVTVDESAKRRVFALARISDDGEHGRDGNLWNNWAFAKTDIDSGDVG